MRCLCKQKEVKELKIEADVGADPIWCDRCHCNLDVEEIPISLNLKLRLMKWIGDYGKWIDWDKDGIVSNGVELEKTHNKEGLKLTEEVQKELEGKYKVSFSPSTFARMHVKE
ncbi:hypothetical protein [Alkalibacillus salilacus]|uniref:Uncharacterized protein n=1 Tax=Alkalibacillus salilacus TaxID=284582 RepID=A0ABT9VIH6_9BACI|nr:hypothetical protein [Alkalibacillus salilacus]MDQ0160758.1 hypothetical protein [Alkalibacillus salilacus]